MIVLLSVFRKEGVDVVSGEGRKKKGREVVVDVGERKKVQKPATRSLYMFRRQAAKRVSKGTRSLDDWSCYAG